MPTQVFLLGTFLYLMLSHFKQIPSYDAFLPRHVTANILDIISVCHVPNPDSIKSHFCEADSIYKTTDIYMKLVIKVKNLDGLCIHCARNIQSRSQLPHGISQLSHFTFLVPFNRTFGRQEM